MTKIDLNAETTREMNVSIIKVAISVARRRAEPVGPSHAYWDFIFDAEACLAGKKTLLQEHDLLRMAQKIQQEWVDDTVQRAVESLFAQKIIIDPLMKYMFPNGKPRH